MPTRLILIRHGETNWNKKKRYSGLADVALNTRGRRQAGRLRERLKGEVIHKVYSSDRKRAAQTAAIIFQKTAIDKVPDLKEMDFGVFEGLTYKQVMKKYPSIYKKWLGNPFGVTIPEGEGLSAFGMRVSGAIKRILSCNRGKTVAVVSHGGAISVFINKITKSEDFWGLIPSSASISIIEFTGARSKVRLLNDTTHLVSRTSRWAK